LREEQASLVGSLLLCHCVFHPFLNNEIFLHTEVKILFQMFQSRVFFLNNFALHYFDFVCFFIGKVVVDEEFEVPLSVLLVIGREKMSLYVEKHKRYLTSSCI
jgi:hypothetical protein